MNCVYLKMVRRMNTHTPLAYVKPNRGEEGKELLTKLIITSKQILGPHHNVTISYQGG